MEDSLITLLETFGYPVYRQGSLTQDTQYPDHFFTFWNVNSTDHNHYDNDNYGVVWEFDVNFYSIDPTLTYSKLNAARNALKAQNWIISGKGYDVPTDEPTHSGRGMTCLYLEI